MDKQPMFVITKSGLIIRLEKLKALHWYIDYYVCAIKGRLALYLEECDEDDTAIALLQGEVEFAEEIDRELEQLTTEVRHIYDRNFEAWAEAFRQARIERGLARIEDSPDLYALLKIVVAMLKSENHWFSEEKFIKYINKGGEASLDDAKLDKRVYDIMTGANPTGRYSAQIRKDGWAQDEAFFDTKAEAQAWLDSYRYEGKIGEGVQKDYQAFFDKWERKAQEGQGGPSNHYKVRRVSTQEEVL
jgi:hypothetical protein